METKIAVVGMGTLFPDARDADQFWQNVISKKVSIRPLPEELFEAEVFYRPELLTALAKDDKSTTKIAGWIENLQFDTVRKYKIPPSVAEHMDTNQHAALYTAAQALEMNPLKEVPKDRVAVIYGNGMVGTQYGDALVRVEFQLVQHYLRKHPIFEKFSRQEQDEVIEYLRTHVLKDSIPISEDSAPGILPNIIAGRIANVYDFHGPSYTVDAACASVLAAVNAGIKGLQLREFDAVLCGGSDMPLKQLGFILFSALNALSPDGSYPFDKRANGFVMGQGSGAVTLKRLDDAIKNNDTIYAVITGYGEASDGKGKYIAAPNAEWQARSIEKACRMAGYPVDTIEMIEAHGTATRVGDVVELDGMKQAFATLGVRRTHFCGVGSAKSNIGHLKSAAGIAGLLKAVLAIHHKVLPPTASFQEINPKLELENSPFYILDEAREWDAKREYPRRANVSSFGFGGADYHIALEEYREEDYPKGIFTGTDVESASFVHRVSTQTVAPASATDLVLFSAGTMDEVEGQVKEFLTAFAQSQGLSFSDFASLRNYTVRANEVCRVAFLASSPEDLMSKLEMFGRAKDAQGSGLLKTKGIFIGQGQARTAAETAVLFPGQASQYLNMLRGVSDGYDVVRTLYRRADAYWYTRRKHTVTSLMFRDGNDRDAALEQLRGTQNAHPSIFITSYALFELLSQMGLAAQYMIGHSLGEITALAAAGIMPFDDALTLVEQRGYAFHDEHLADPGKMLSFPGSPDEARPLIEESRADVTVANFNSPRQTIIAGASPAVDRFKEFLDARKINAKMLFVSHAFHTPLMRSVSDRFYESIKGLKFQPSPIRVAMNHAGTYYPDDQKSLQKMPELLRDQILQPVNFVASIEKLYSDGVRLFVEVGPGSILSGLVKEILSGRDINVITTNFKNTDDVAGFQKACGALFAEGVPIKLMATRSSSPTFHEGATIPPTPQPTSAAPVQELPGAKGDEYRGAQKSTIVYSGAAIGLPGSYKQAFSDDNFEQLFEGRNLLERLTDEEKQKLVDLQITKLIKDESGPTFKLLVSLDDVIQLAGKIGRFDMIREYHIDEKVVQNMTSSIALGVAAGYEALKDARIPLVREYMRTTTGKLLPQKLALPREMQEETGVIFANGFPLIDPVIQEVSRHVSYYYGSKTRKDLMAFYESIISRIKDDDARKLLTDWYTLYYSRLSDTPGQEEVYRFNHHFMTQISAQANNLLAFLLNAKGPNFQLNAACSSTSNAISIAEDFIRTGRVKRMIVVGADDPTSRTNLPILGAGFLCTGAATNEGDLYKAAVPFDRRRNGMLVGSGAVGIVLETKEEMERRGVVEICELLGTHSFNTAKHISQIDSETFSLEFQKFISRMEREHGLRRKDIARQAVYISHETCTPPRGGCSQTEAEALRKTFGEEFRNLIVGNTKGMTGHTMGASLEDALAAKSLQYGKCPPVVNFSESDPMLEGLHLWKGGEHNRTFALKMSAGFGSQGHFALLKKSCSGDNRIADHATYTAWLKSVGADGEDGIELRGRVLVVKDGGPESKETLHRIEKNVKPAVSSAAREPAPTTVAPGPSPRKPATDTKRIADKIVDTISQLTQYPPEMLEPEMEFGADLGIGDEKRSVISDKLNEEFGIPQGRISIGAEATIGQLTDHVAKEIEKQHTVTPPTATAPLPASAVAGRPGKESITADVLKVFSEVTKYPEDMLDLNMEMEADLGIDTVKQATILSILGEKYRMERQEGMQLSNFPTIGHIVDLVYEAAGGGVPASSQPAPAQQPSGVQQTSLVEVQPLSLEAPSTESKPEPATSGDVKQAIVAETLRVFSEVTKYPEDMLELDMEMEADLGIDTVKQATILSLLGEKYQLERQEGMQLSNYPTIRHIVDLIIEHGKAAQPDSVKIEEPSLDGTEATPLEGDRVVPVWETSLSRQTPYLVEEPLGGKEYDLAGKNVWILGDEKPLVELIAGVCKQRKLKVRSFVFPRATSVTEGAREFATFADQSAVDVLIDCTHVGSVDATPFHQLPPRDAHDMLLRCSEARFAAYKHLSSRKKHPARIICMTSIDGYLGMDAERSHVVDPTFGATVGFYKGLRKEWTDTSVRIVDFAPQAIADSPEACLHRVFDEIEHAGLGVEIAYPRNTRMVVKIDDKEISAGERITFSASDTVLITGGGTGIASRVLLALARAYPANFVVVDVVPLPENIASLAALDEAGLQKVKNDLKDELRRSHAKVTPVMLNKEFDKITKAIQIQSTLEEVRRLNRQVVYIPCDVRDHATLERSLNTARSTVGSITAIVHAAGIDISHMLDQKSHEEFHNVFTVKAIGAYNLMHLCQNDPLKLVVSFSSISGRFGNPAQLDYCAANHFLNDWTKMMHLTHPDVHAVSIAWSGWKDLGIAWRNEVVRSKALEMGINFIEVEQGVGAFLREITNLSGDREVILHNGLDGFVERGLSRTNLSDSPLIDRITTKNGRVDRAYRLFSVQRDAMIDQHRLGKVPIMPAVGYAELAVEYYALQAGVKEHYLLRDMTFSNAFKLFREQPREIYVEGSELSGGGGWSVEMKSSFKPPRAEQAQTVLHSRATVAGDLPELEDLHPEEWSYHREQPTRLPAEQSLLLIKSEGPEQRIILGPLFNDVLRESKYKEPVLIYPGGATYPTYFPREQLTNEKYPLNRMFVNPCFLDSIYQACAAHLLVTRKRVYLPWEIRELGIVYVPRQEGLYTSYAQVVGEADDTVSFNVVMADGDGNLCYFARDARFRLINL